MGHFDDFDPTAAQSRIDRDGREFGEFVAGTASQILQEYATKVMVGGGFRRLVRTSVRKRFLRGEKVTHETLGVVFPIGSFDVGDYDYGYYYLTPDGHILHAHDCLSFLSTSVGINQKSWPGLPAATDLLTQHLLARWQAYVERGPEAPGHGLSYMPYDSPE